MFFEFIQLGLLRGRSQALLDLLLEVADEGREPFAVDGRRRGRRLFPQFPCGLELHEVVEHEAQIAEDAALHVALREHEGRERRVQRVLSWQRLDRFCGCWRLWRAGSGVLGAVGHR